MKGLRTSNWRAREWSGFADDTWCCARAQIYLWLDTGRLGTASWRVRGNRLDFAVIDLLPRESRHARFSCSARFRFLFSPT